MKILLTGFTPFNNDEINPSFEAIKNIKSFSNFNIKVIELPTSFNDSYKILNDEVNNFKPDFVLSFGLAGGRKGISFETIGINLINSKIPDNDGNILNNKKIKIGGNDGYFTTINNNYLCEILNKNGYEAFISYTAGCYVCNYIIYNMLYDNIKFKRNLKYGFIHLPYSTGMKNHNNEYNKPIKYLTDAIILIIKNLEKGE